MRDVYTGIFYVNAPTIGAETHLPFAVPKRPVTDTRSGYAALDVSANGNRFMSISPAPSSGAQIDNAD